MDLKLPITIHDELDEEVIESTGVLDLASGQIDALLRSDPKSTGSLALDLPLRVTGPLDNPSVSPRLDGAPTWLAEPQPLPAALDPASRALASRRGCTP